MPHKDPDERRRSVREASRRHRDKKRTPPPGASPGDPPLPALTFRKTDDVLTALELACSIAHARPYCAQIVISAARAAGAVLQARVDEDRLAALEDVLARRGEATT